MIVGISVLRACQARLLNNSKKVTTKRDMSYVKKLLYWVPYSVTQLLVCIPVHNFKEFSHREENS